MKTKGLMMLLRKRAPTLCLIASIASGAAALYFTGKATVKAVRKYDKLKEKGVDLTPKVIVKQFVPYYIPAIGFATVSLTTSIAGHIIQAKRNRVLKLAAINAAETLRDFKNQSKDILGEDKYNEIEEEVAKKRPVLKGDGDYDSPIRVYDIWTGVKIETTYKKLYEAEAMVNEALSESGYSKGEIDLKTFYMHLGATEKQLEWIIMSEKKWEACYMWGQFESNWVTFKHQEVYDRDGMLMVILEYSPDPEYEDIIEEDIGYPFV